MNGPCMDCDHRHPACHGTCEVYKAWQAPFLAAREERMKRLATDNFIHEGHYRGWKKYRKKWQEEKMAKDFNCAYQDYSGSKRYIVIHPAHAGDDLTMAAPDENSAIVAAADRWGEKWTRIDFYCYFNVIRQQAEKTKGRKK